MNFEPVVLFIKQNEIDERIDDVLTPVNDLQTILDTTNKLNCEPFTTNEFINLFTETKKTLFKKLTQNQNSNFAGLEVDSEKMFDIISKPDAVFEIIQQIASLNENPETRFYARRVVNFEVNNGVLEIKRELIDGITNELTIYATTPTELAIYTSLKQIETTFNDLQDLKKLWHLDEKMFIEIFDYNKNTHQIDLKKDFLRAYR